MELRGPWDSLRRTTMWYLLSAALAFAVCVIGISSQGTAEAADWPNWRGPNHNGISDETGWTAAWPKDGPKLLWKASLGTGFSSIAVSSGRLYSMGNINDNDIIYCLDANTGKELWRHSYPSPIDAKLYEGGPNATPTVDGNRVYTLSKRGKVFCLDAETGNVVWNRDLQEDFGIKPPNWGLAGSPFILDNIVVLNAGTWGIALDKATGSLIWQNGKDPAGYATVVPYTMGDRKCLAMFGAEAAAGLIAKTGQKLWELPWKTSYDLNAADPIISGNTVFISSGYNKGCALLKIRNDNVTQLWHNKNMRNQCSSSVLWNGYIYGFDGQVGGSGVLTCINYETAEVKWTKTGMGTGSLMLADGKLIILAERGKLVIAEASPDGFKQLSDAQILQGKCWTVPVLANDRIYARNAVGDLVCVDVRATPAVLPLQLRVAKQPAGAEGTTVSGRSDWPQFRGPNRNGKSAETGLLKKWPEGGPELLWSVEGLGMGFASVAVAKGFIYTTGLIGSDAVLFAYDLNGKLQWKQSYGPEWTGAHKGARTTPTVDDDRLYVMSGMGIISCFNAGTGAKKWQVDTLKRFQGQNIKWGIAESVLIEGEKVICTPGGKDATVVALDKMTGETIWTTNGLSETSAYCCPVIIERDGERLLATMVQKSIVLIDPENGKVLCRIPHIGKHFISAVSPVYKDGYIYGTTGYGIGGGMYELSTDAAGYTQKWSDKNLDCHHGGVLLLDGNIHGSNHIGKGNKGSWICLELATGEVKYEDKLVGKGSVIFADGMLYCYGEKGTVALVRVAPPEGVPHGTAGYEMVSSFEVTKGTDEHWAHPAISDGRLYIRHGDALMAYDIKAK